MSDPVDLAIGAGVNAATLGAAVWAALKFSAKRNLDHLDETLKNLQTAIENLGRDIRALRETDIAQAKDIGALEKEDERLRDRVDKLADHWRGRLERLEISDRKP